MILDCFTKCLFCVRLGSAFSFWFRICAGVRQGVVLSLCLFAVYMHSLILIKVRCPTGSHIHSKRGSIKEMARDRHIVTTHH